MIRFFLEKNAIIAGVLAGLVIPFVGFAVLLMIFEQLESLGVMKEEGLRPNFRQRTSSLIAICLNLLPMNFYRNRKFYQSMRGIVFSTLACVVAWVAVFAGSLFS